LLRFRNLSIYLQFNEKLVIMSTITFYCAKCNFHPLVL